MDDPATQSQPEPEPTTLEKVGESMKNAGEYVCESLYEGARKVGLIKGTEGENEDPMKQLAGD